MFLVAVFFQLYSSMPNYSHPIAHPLRRHGAVRSSVPQGKRCITAQMTATINKYIRKRNKGKLLVVREYSLLGETYLPKSSVEYLNWKVSYVCLLNLSDLILATITSFRNLYVKRFYKFSLMFN